MIRYHARWVLPISSAPIEHGTVVEHDGRIVYAGPRTAAPPGEDHDLGDVALLPGLVNAHTHLELTTLRGQLEDLPFHDWIARLRDSRDWLFSGSVALDAAHDGITEGLRSGTTTYADTSATGSAARAIAETGVRGIVYQEVFGPDPGKSEVMLEELRQRIADLREHEGPLLRIGVSPHAPYTVSDDLYRATAHLAAEEGLPLAAHIAESVAESQLVADGAGPFAAALQRRGIPTTPRGETPIALVKQLGVLGPNTLLIHCAHVNERDIATIADSGSSVAHCPLSNAKLGHGVAPLLEMLDSGIRVGLGTDSMASSNRMELLDEARLAVLMQRARSGRHDALSAGGVLRMLTLGGAEALGLAHAIGSLEVGKAADLAAFPVDPRQPADVGTALIFSQYDRRAMFVCVAGRVLVADGRVLEQPATVH